MSVETWKEEFYPTNVESVPPEQAAAHSLQKWKGFRKENLEKHNVTFNGNVLGGDGRFYFDGTTCALCLHFQYNGCFRCPLAIVRADKQSDYIACDETRIDEHTSPWHARYDTPDPMIKWLEKAVQYQKDKAQSVDTSKQECDSVQTMADIAETKGDKQP